MNRFRASYGGVLVAVVLVMVPLAITPGFTLYYDVTSKAAVLCIAAALMTFTVPLAWGPLWRSRAGRALLIVIVAAAASVLMSTVFSTSAARSISGTVWRRFGAPVQLSLLVFLVQAIYVTIRNPRAPALLCRAVCLTLLAVSAYAVCQFLELDPILQRQLYSVGQYNQPILRPPSTLGSGPGLGNFAMMAVFLALTGYGWDASRAWRVVAGVAAAAGSVAVLLSGTRSAVLGLLIGGAVLGARRFRKPSRPAWLGILACVVLLTAVCLVPQGRYLRNRAVQAWGDWKGGTRLWLWRNSLPMLRAHPLTGFGLETFAAEFPVYEAPELARTYPDSYNESAHNVLLDTWVSQGIFGAATLVALFSLALIRGWRGSREPGFDALFAGLVAILITFQFFSLDITSATYAAFTLALLLAAPLREIDRAAFHREGMPLRVCRTWAAILLAGFAAEMSGSDFLLQRANRELSAGQLRPAIASFESATGWAPPGFNSSLWFARTLMSAGARTGQSEAVLIPATRFAADACANAEDPHNACYYYAVLLAAAGDTNSASRELRKCTAIAPSWYAPFWSLARIEAARGNSAEATRLGRRAVDLGGRHASEIEDSLKEFGSYSRDGRAAGH